MRLLSSILPTELLMVNPTRLGQVRQIKLGCIIYLVIFHCLFILLYCLYCCIVYIVYIISSFLSVFKKRYYFICLVSFLTIRQVVRKHHFFISKLSIIIVFFLPFRNFHVQDPLSHLLLLLLRLNAFLPGSSTGLKLKSLLEDFFKVLTTIKRLKPFKGLIKKFC